MRASFALAGFAQKLFSLSAWRKQFGFLAQSLRFFGKAGFKGFGRVGMAMLHDVSPNACGS